MPAAGPFVTAATMSEMSAAHRAFWLPLSQQSETASDVNCEIHANEEMMFLGAIAKQMLQSKVTIFADIMPPCVMICFFWSNDPIDFARNHWKTNKQTNKQTSKPAKIRIYLLCFDVRNL